jgi:hypothetical protein
VTCNKQVGGFFPVSSTNKTDRHDKPKYQKKTTDLPQVTDKLYEIMLNGSHLMIIMSGIRTTQCTCNLKVYIFLILTLEFSYFSHDLSLFRQLDIQRLLPNNWSPDYNSDIWKEFLSDKSNKDEPELCSIQH